MATRNRTSAPAPPPLGEVEVYDLVDRNDRPVCRGTREDAKRLDLWRRCVHVFVFNPEELLLICKRTRNARSYPNLYTSSAGGSVHLGETYLAAARREVYEELGIGGRLIGVGLFQVIGVHGKVLHHLYRTTTGTVCPDEREVAAHTFVDINTLTRDITRHPGRYAYPFRKALALYLTTT